MLSIRGRNILGKQKLVLKHHLHYQNISSSRVWNITKIVFAISLIGFVVSQTSFDELSDSS
jgi:hypothetical protein